jgi:hypothetical protein
MKRNSPDKGITIQIKKQVLGFVDPLAASGFIFDE